MRGAGTVHTRPPTSNSSHVASRTSPDRAAVRTSSSKASLSARVALDARTAPIAAATSPWGNARMCRTTSRCGPRTGPIRSQGCRSGTPSRCSTPGRRGGAVAECGQSGFDVPEWGEDLQHAGAADLGDGPGTDAGEHVAFQVVAPVGRLPGAAPAGPLLLDHGVGGLGERGLALEAALVGERVAAVACELAVGAGLLAGLGERGEVDAAESEFVLPAANDEALDPASGPGALDVEVESVPVSVPADGRGADEGGGESVVRVSALGAWSWGGWLRRVSHYPSPIMYEMPPDFTLRPSISAEPAERDIDIY